MIDPRSRRFLDLRFKRLRYLWWKYVTLRPWDMPLVRQWALRGHSTYAEHMRSAQRRRRISECAHENRKPNPDALVEALGHLTAFARRQPKVVAKFTTDPPTNWDRAHGRIDEALADLLNTRP